jgi:hypothetical protein
LALDRLIVDHEQVLPIFCKVQHFLHLQILFSVLDLVLDLVLANEQRVVDSELSVADHLIRVSFPKPNQGKHAHIHTVIFLNFYSLRVRHSLGVMPRVFFLFLQTSQVALITVVAHDPFKDKAFIRGVLSCLLCYLAAHKLLGITAGADPIEVSILIDALVAAPVLTIINCDFERLFTNFTADIWLFHSLGVFRLFRLCVVLRVFREL